MVKIDLDQRRRRVRGWLSLQEAKVLERLAKEQVVMEIGSYFGRSTVVMAEVAKKVICIDFFLTIDDGTCVRDATGRTIPPAVKPETRNIFERNVKPWRHKIEVHEMNSLDAVKLNWEPVGLLFIDGGHDFATVVSDCGFRKWVIVGGHVAFHDFNGWRSVAQAVRHVMSEDPRWVRVKGKYGTMAIFQRVQVVGCT